MTEKLLKVLFMDTRPCFESFKIS